MGATISREEAQQRGLKWYYTGVKCRNGHIRRRRTTTGQCQGCADIGSAQSETNLTTRQIQGLEYGDLDWAKVHSRQGEQVDYPHPDWLDDMLE